MRKKIYAILLATVLAGSLASGCMTVFASETEAVTSGTEAEGSEALQASETEAETDWDGLQVTEITLSRAEGVSENYVILFAPDAGYMIIVAGMSDMGELEKIAKGLDIRVTDTPVSASWINTGIDAINLGRG